jgi:hypothetical protein
MFMLEFVNGSSVSLGAGVASSGYSHYSTGRAVEKLFLVDSVFHL